MEEGRKVADSILNSNSSLSDKVFESISQSNDKLILFESGNAPPSALEKAFEIFSRVSSPLKLLAKADENVNVSDFFLAEEQQQQQETLCSSMQH